jgi:predicted metallopeptidase
LGVNEEVILPGSPYVRSWHAASKPLPIRGIYSPVKSRAHPLTGLAPPWLASGDAAKPFDFCGHVLRLCADITARCPELHYVDVSRLLFAVTQARNNRKHGLQARLTPLRFHNGQLTRRRRGTSYQVQRYFVGGQEVLYVLTFCLPRFLNQDFDDKLITLFHELYHISPAFDGDLRRHDGRYAIHSHSKRDYDQQMAHLARAYLANGADPGLHSFLRLNFEQLQERHGQVLGVVVPRPKLVPVVEQAAAKRKAR